MSVHFLEVVGNKAPDLSITLEINDAVIDLTGASGVKLIIVNEQTGEVTNASHQSCTISDAANGVITYSKDGTEFPAEGRYTADVEITFTLGNAPMRLYEYVTVAVRQRNDIS